MSLIRVTEFCHYLLPEPLHDQKRCAKVLTKEITITEVNITQIPKTELHLPRLQNSWGQHGVCLGPVGPHEPCYQGITRRGAVEWVAACVFIKSDCNGAFLACVDLTMSSSWLQMLWCHTGTRPSVTSILGAVSIRKTVLPGMAIPMLKIRRPNGGLIFNMEIAIRR